MMIDGLISLCYITCRTYSVSQKNPPWGLVTIFPKRLGIFQPNFTCLLCVPIYARLRIFIQLSAILMKLYYIKCDHPVHIMCAKCLPSTETHSCIFWHFSQTVGKNVRKFGLKIPFPNSWDFFSPNFTRVLNVHTYARMQIFIHLSPTLTKLCAY